MIDTLPSPLRARILRTAASNLLDELNRLNDVELAAPTRQQIKNALDNVARCADRLDGKRGR